MITLTATQLARENKIGNKLSFEYEIPMFPEFRSGEIQS